MALKSLMLVENGKLQAAEFTCFDCDYLLTTYLRFPLWLNVIYHPARLKLICIYIVI